MLFISLVYLRRTIQSVDLSSSFFWFLFLCYTVLSSAYSTNPSHAFVSTVSLIGAFLFLLYSCVHYGKYPTLFSVVVCAGALFIGSLLLYFVSPSLARMGEWVGPNYVLSWRLQGLLGSANGVGVSSAAVLLLLVVYRSVFSRSVAAVVGLAA